MADHHLHTGCTLGELIVRALHRDPSAVALARDDRTLTFGELSEAISRAIQAFKALGLKTGDGLAQLAGNQLEATVVRKAATIMGLRYTALHPLGSAEDHAFILQDAEVAALSVDITTFAERGRALAGAVPGLKRVLTLGPADFGDDLTAEMARHAPRPLVPEARPDESLYLLYTGGTTGRSKGVVLSHRSLVTCMLHEQAEWDWPAEVRFLAATPVSHAAGAMVIPVWMRNGTFHMQAGFDPEAFLAAIEKHRITATFLVPTMIYVLLDHPRIRDFDLSSLKLIIYGAAPMSPTRMVEAMEVFGPVFMQLYGQTEAPNTITTLRLADHDLARPERLGSCGRPTGSSDVRVLDADLNEVGAGEVGEICVRGPLVMDGYWKRPEETEQTLRGGWLHTGDMARRDEDGYLYIVDRSKDMIVSGGFNVFPKEVEEILMIHAAVSNASVIAVPDDKWGEAVKAVVVLKPDAQASEEALISLVRERKGPVYAPKSVDFVDAIPVTALGKPDKKQLRARYWGDAQRQVH